MTDPDRPRHLWRVSSGFYGGPSRATGVSPYVMPTRPMREFLSGELETDPGYAASLVSFDTGPATGLIAGGGAADRGRCPLSPSVNTRTSEPVARIG